MKNEEKYLESENNSKKVTLAGKPDENEELRSKDEIMKICQNHFVISKAHISNKIIFLAFFLTICGFALIITGFVEYSKYNDAEKCLAFWIIGGFCGVPGLFYLGKIVRFWRSQNEEEKNEIINEMPEWS